MVPRMHEIWTKQAVGEGCQVWGISILLISEPLPKERPIIPFNDETHGDLIPVRDGEKVEEGTFIRFPR